MRTLVLLALMAPLAGCGQRAATVSGQVTVDDQPLKKGVIVFAPADGNGPPAQATIENGRYEVETLPGNKRVQISAPVVIGKKKEYDAPDAPLVEITGESLPDRYHSNSELTFEVKVGANAKDWPLTVKKR